MQGSRREEAVERLLCATCGRFSFPYRKAGPFITPPSAKGYLSSSSLRVLAIEHRGQSLCFAGHIRPVTYNVAAAL